MNVSNLAQNSFLRHATADLNSRLSQAQEQVATGKRAATHGDLGLQANAVQALRAEVNAIDGFQQTQAQTATRMESMQASLDTLYEGSIDQRDLINGAIYRNDVALPFVQDAAEGRLADAVGKLNLQVEGRYLFSGRTTQTRPVAGHDAILNGADGAAGLKQATANRVDADAAATLATSTTAGAVTVSDAGNTQLGLSVQGVDASAATASDGADASATFAPADALEDATVNFGAAAPAAGDTVTVTLGMPDGDKLDLVFAAGEAAGAVGALNLEGGDQRVRLGFDPGGSGADAAANLKAALDGAIAEIKADPAFEASSRVKAADDFFADGGPVWVTGGGTVEQGASGDVVHWYRGDDQGDISSSQLARIAEGQVVDYGVRADQSEIVGAVKSMAMMAATGVGEGADQTETEVFRAFAARAGAGSGRAVDEMTQVQSSLGVKQELVERVGEQHAEQKSLISERVAEIERADPYEVATKIADLRQQLEATYTITGRMQGLSLVNFMT